MKTVIKGMYTDKVIQKRQRERGKEGKKTRKERAINDEREEKKWMV